jgi:hypothetical protein
LDSADARLVAARSTNAFRELGNALDGPLPYQVFLQGATLQQSISKGFVASNRYNNRIVVACKALTEATGG